MYGSQPVNDHGTIARQRQLAATGYQMGGGPLGMGPPPQQRMPQRGVIGRGPAGALPQRPQQQESGLRQLIAQMLAQRGGR